MNVFRICLALVIGAAFVSSPEAVQAKPVKLTVEPGGQIFHRCGDKDCFVSVGWTVKKPELYSGFKVCWRLKNKKNRGINPCKFTQTITKKNHIVISGTPGKVYRFVLEGIFKESGKDRKQLKKFCLADISETPRLKCKNSKAYKKALEASQ